MATKLPFAQGAQVEHPKFGLGSVLSCDEERIVIKFDEHGEKKFVLSNQNPKEVLACSNMSQILGNFSG